MRLEQESVPVKHALSRSEFFDRHYSANLPVVITGMMNDWPAMRKWNLDFFARDYGDHQVEVQMDRDKDADYEIERGKHAGTMLFREFVEKVRDSGSNATNDFYMTANNTSNNKKALAGLWNDFTPFPAYLTAHDPAAGFLWFGPRGTITPFHHDLTNNFMAQVMGSKRVKLAPFWDMPLMRNDFNVYSRVDGRVTPVNARPESLDTPQILEVILKPGDLLFIPIGWMHFVEGLEISVTMTFTNFLYDNDFVSFYSTYDRV
jgi:ribosomal protein L16 Arg81 hydroxylase